MRTAGVTQLQKSCNVPFRFKTAKPLAPFLIPSSSHFAAARSALKLGISLLKHKPYAIKPAAEPLQLASFFKELA
jgi:hypothetical protein